MATNHLLDYIGIKGHSTAPDSGLFVNQLSGITLESIDKIAEREKEGFAGLWADIQERAWIVLEKDFKRALRKCFSLDTHIDYTYFIEDYKEDFKDVWWYLLGSELMMERAYTSRMNRFTTIDLDRALELRDFYNAEYAKALQEAVASLKIEEDKPMHTSPRISVVESLP